MDILCGYGCGQEGKFQLKSGKSCCSKSWNSCPAIIKKNSKAIKLAHREGRCFSGFKGKEGWSKGLTKETNTYLKDRGDKLHERYLNNEIQPSFLGKKHSSQTRNQISKSRTIYILNHPETYLSGRYFKKGYYKGLYFHSSWELAFFVYYEESNNLYFRRNNSEYLLYNHNNITHRTIPDFKLNINEKDFEYIEIKGRMDDDQAISKYNQTKDKVKYLFFKDVIPYLNYCVNKYGENFYNILYEKKTV